MDESTEASLSLVDTRTATGQFVKGASGNPSGRPVGRKTEIVQLKQDMELAIRSHVKPEKLKRIVEKVINKAMNGNLQAAKLIFDHFITKATETEEVSDHGKGLTIRIENATFMAKAEPTTVTVTEGQFEETK